MSRINHVWTSVQDLAVKGVVLAIAMSMCVSLNSLVEDAGADPRPNAEAMIEPSPVRDAGRVTMSVPEDRLSSHYSMRDENGREAVLVTYHRNGAIAVLLGEDLPARAACWTTTKGVFKLSVAHLGRRHTLMIQPDGSSDYVAYGQSDEIRDRLSLASESERPPGGQDSDRP